MTGNLFRGFSYAKQTICLCLVIIIILGTFSNVFLPQAIEYASAAQSTIDADASAVGTSHIMSGSQTVFIDDQTGYKFFVDAPGYCVYRKTTDGGASWSATTTIDVQIDCLAISVWYDKWTPGSASSSIHIATLDGNPDDVWYNRLDTSGDTLLMSSNPVSVTTAQGGTIAAGANQVSITRGTDGTIYVSSIDASDSYVMECTFTCNLAGSWSETGTNPFGLTNNYAILAPLPNGDILAIHRDVNFNQIGSKVWNNGAASWDVATTTFDASAPENTTYDVGMAMTVSTTTGDIYLAYVARNATPGADDQIRTARYSGGSWALTKEVVRYSERGITNVAIALDTSNDDIYVAYSARTIPGTATTSNVYWRKSTDDMVSWTYENGPLNSSADDLYGVDLNISSNERIYASWFDNTDDDIYGETVADIFPGVHVTSEVFPEINSADSYTQVSLDTTAHANGTSNIMSGSQTVFIDDQTGYKFFRDAPGNCVYSKTTNGGTSWSATTTVDSQSDCHQVQVWYDRWTPGSASSSIHILTADAGADDLWYNRLDVAGDTLLMGTTPVSMTTGQGGSLAETENYVSITRGTDGTLYAVSNDGTTGPDSFIVECTFTCSLAGSWSETGVNPLDSASDFNILMPLTGGDIMLINRDISDDLIRYKIWDNSIWSVSWTSIAGSATENATYDVGMAAAVSSTTGNLYLAYIANNATPGTDDELRTSYYSGGSWATTTVVSTSTVLGLTNVAIGLDYSNDDVYVAYSARATAGTAATANILWKKSTDNMTTWDYEQGPVNTSPDDIYGVDLNMSGDGRIYVSWYDATDDDIYGATMIDLPSTAVVEDPVQISSLYASTTNVYIGGRFVLYNTYDPASRDVTGITITENGSIDALTSISNIKLLYETDTVAPYDCVSVSYNGNEALFGSIDTNGFSGSDGVSSFTGTTVTLSSTTALCVYPVFDVLDSALSSSTIEIGIANPQSDVTVTSDVAGPSANQDIEDSTLVYNDTPTLTHYHWRNDDGTEATATSKTSGVEDTSLTSMRQGSTTRLRVQVSNEGSSSTPGIQYRLEYAPNPSSCELATGWTDVGASNGDFDMSDSANLTEATNTINIANGIGGVTDSNDSFLSPNTGVRDVTSQTDNIVLSTAQFVELEYSIVASTTATEGNTYCFRVTDQGNALFAYDQYPRANIAADVLVTIATSSQYATTSIPAINYHVGSSFVITENTGSRDVTSITITENGSIDASTALSDVKLHYDLDTTNPYNCASETYNGNELQFGATSTNGFTAPNGTTTFTGTVAISTTSTMCVYTVISTTGDAQNGNTIDIIMEDPSLNLLVTGGGSVSPSITRDMNGSTTLVGAILTQTHYHWRSDNGTEITAPSLTGGLEDTAVSNISQTTPVRLRIQVSNEGLVESATTSLRIEYGAKISTCSAVTSWTDVGAFGGAWDMYASTNLTDAENTTNIAVETGGVTDENSTFISPNFAVKEASSSVASTTATSTQFIEAEFSMQQTISAGNDITYCFRLSAGGTALNAYSIYPELTTSPERDFEIQRGTLVMTSTTTTLTAGVHYTAPSASTSAFIRITNSHHTGAGNNFGGAAQNADDITAYILNPSDIMNSVSFVRPAAASGTTRLSWEIIEFIGEAASDNEMIVRGQGAITYGTTALSATTTAIAGVVDSSDLVIFITGQGHPDTLATNYNSGQSTAQWSSASSAPAFWRGVSGNDATVVSYAVVEFTGPNWAIQRSEHTYASAGTTETESIVAVNSLTQAFIHTQKRIITGLTGIDEYGHEVWLSGMGQVSYFLQSGATTPSGQTSVAWIIENTQTTAGAMDVTRSNNTLGVDTSPATTSININKTLTDLTNASIFTNTRSAGTGTNYPRPIVGVTIASTTHYQFWRGNAGAALTYRTEVVEWPTAGLAVRQNDYRFYVDNNAILPTKPWPVSGEELGENEAVTAIDDPLGEGDRIRIRMSLRAYNATLPAGTRAFKLQYGVYITSCSAISESNWVTLGDTASSTVWRGYNATGTTDGTPLSGDPPTDGDLLLTSSFGDVAGTFEEINNTDSNAYAVPDGEDIEYDWLIEQNGANAETYYCFRMVETSGAPVDGYNNYPQIRTASFTPRTQNWRWYDDELNAHPTTTLAAENVAPINITNTQALKLRVTVKEIKNIARDDVRFKLQYSEHANFSEVFDVVSTSTCIATSTWCYINGGGADNAIISTTTLSDTDSCVLGVGDGCGTRNESPNVLTGFRHENDAAAEYEFAIQAAAPRVNRVYYFRLYDIVQDIPVTINTSESYPSLVTEGASLSFDIAGVASSTVLEGVTLDVDTTPTTLNFGTLSASTSIEGAHRLAVDANGTQGYLILMMLTGDLLSSTGGKMQPITGTNATPVAWDIGCDVSAISCLGYHVGDDTLQGGSVRFSPQDTYARFSTTTLEEVGYSSQPVVGETTDIIFRIFRRELQDAGQYETNIMYVTVPIF